MNCDKAQELILTDHLDGCLSGPLDVQLKEHLAACRACGEFAAVAQKTLAEPFEKLPQEPMPDTVRQAIMDQVRERQSPQEGWWERLREVFKGWDLVPAPAVAWVAAMAVCFIMVGVGFGVNRVQVARQKERVMYLAEVAEFTEASPGTGTDYGTSIESYFLNNGGSI